MFAVLEFRIRSPEHKWRCVYKALQVLEYLVQRGSSHCCTAAQELVVPLAALQNFVYVGPVDQKDYGQNVRLRAEAVKSLILDAEGLAQKRAQLAARAANMKFAGYSREALVAAAGAGDAAVAGALRRGESPPGRPVTPTPTLGPGVGGGSVAATAVASVAPAAPGSPSEGPSSPSAYRPPSLFMTASAARTGPQSSSLRNAGETKGVTFEQNKKQLEQLRQLTLLEGNRICADCASAVAAARPTWASINLGVFICMRCAGIHRGLGVHISKVRSTTLDTWLPDQVATMARLGNRRANAHFEARLDPALRPSRDNTLELEKFIRLKYADKVWADKGPWPPEEDAVAVAVTVTPSAASQSITASGKQANGGALRSSSPPLPSGALLDAGPATWPSSWPPVAGSVGGGFGDAPPAWPSPTSSLTPPSSSQPSRTQQPPQQPQQQPVARLATAPPASGARSGVGGTAIRLLPPPPSTGTPGPGLRFGAVVSVTAAAAAGPAPGTGGVMSGSSADLLQLDSDSDDDGEAGAGGGGGGARTGDGAAGGPPSGAAALWDLLDPTLDVMTWLDRVEGANQQQQPLPPAQAQQLPQSQAQRPLQKQPSHQRAPSAPVFGSIPAGPPGASFASPHAVYPAIGTPPAGLMTTMPLSGGTAMAVAPAAGRVAAAVAGGTTPAAGGGSVGGPSAQRLAVAESVIMTAEFPVYDLLTPLPTGGGAAAPPTAAAAGGAVARYYTTPPTQPVAAQAYPHVYPHHSAPHSAPLVLQQHGGAAQPLGAGGGAGGGISSGPSSAAAMLSSGLAATVATSTAAATPPGGVPVLQRNSSGLGSAGVAQGGGMMGMCMRGGAAPTAAPAAAAGPGPTLDLDNLLAMQLDNLGSSLAGGPNGNSGGAVGRGRPSWHPPAAVGGAFGGAGSGPR